MNVSVIIPAHNAAETISETLESLLAQNFSHWEAIVVDDGSTDDTLEIANRFSQQDSRIRVVSQSSMGVCGARNTGIQHAQNDWLLFLDADDWILPQHLDRLIDATASNPNLDVVYSSWARVTPDGASYDEKFGPVSNMFPWLACNNAFVIHACIVRRSVVNSAGGFDASFQTCEDWDLWQRIARSGACFGSIPDNTARYRMRTGSASTNLHRLLEDGLRIVTNGHSSDVRVTEPSASYANGQPQEELPGAKLNYICWLAGLAIGHGNEPNWLLNAVQQEHYPHLNPELLAHYLFTAPLLITCRPPSAWDELWFVNKRQINEFLKALEEQSKATALAHRVCQKLEELVVEHSKAPQPLIIGSTYLMSVDVTQPIPNVNAPLTSERLYCCVTIEGKLLGNITLPIFDGFVSAYVLKDAIASQFTWTILEHYFDNKVYRQLTFKRDSTGLSVWRGSVCLGSGIQSDEQTLRSDMHNIIGWTVFLQEVWGRPNWEKENFYIPYISKKGILRELQTDIKNLFSKGWLETVAETFFAPKRRAQNGTLTVEITQKLPNVIKNTQNLTVIPTLGGVPLGTVTVEETGNLVRTQQLRAAISQETGMELAVVAVREGLLGKPIAQATLRPRNWNQLGEFLLLNSETELPKFPIQNYGTDSGVVLARHSGTLGTSISRRAMLPQQAIPDLMEAASVIGEPVVKLSGSGNQPQRVIYAPELIWFPPKTANTSTQKPQPKSPKNQPRTITLREHFETLFALQPDPWKYTSPYEQKKYEQTLELLPSIRFEQVLELACAEGHFTVQLAPKVNNLLAVDISQVALERTKERCAGFSNISYQLLDLTKDQIPGKFDLIICSEVLYYVGGIKELQAFARRVADALNPGGYYITAHANLVVDEPDRPGYNWDHPFGAKVIGETFASTHPLQLVKELRTPLYRIQLFRHTDGNGNSSPQTPEIIEMPQPTPPPAVAEADVLWNGGLPQYYDEWQVVTEKLPILMYHRVHPEGSPLTASWRVTPETFEAQLRYLRDAGYYSVTLEDWQKAIRFKTPLPGRAVLITFDDGYQDFQDYAWPLLEKYGFSATVFLVAEQIGATNSWDSAYGEERPLLGWEQIRFLQEQGVEFGSHSATHPHLTGLSKAEVVREAARSRAILHQGLGQAPLAFAYPYGETDGAIEHLIGACGYVFGLTCKPGLNSFQDSLLTLRRIEISGEDGVQEFVTKLNQ
jgi:peptidoglycan/xylan/chitin deacetylase (PgdA/CDA1 family)/2-polyprenyl-3-methyl-5-hydroxy-6-metoxy-1,4-benzoquinol methylase